MDPSDITISSLASESDALTVLHAESGLPTEHHSRRTEEGFLIAASKLPNSILLPTVKRPPTSWVWELGPRPRSPQKAQGCAPSLIVQSILQWEHSLSLVILYPRPSSPSPLFRIIYRPCQRELGKDMPLQEPPRHRTQALLYR
jgi:hypothetical protein